MAKRSKPDSISICGHNVTISFHKPKENETIENWGTFDPTTNHIMLIDYEGWRRVLLHEITHAIFHYTGISALFKNEEIEEAVVTAIEYGLYPICSLSLKPSLKVGKGL